MNKSTKLYTSGQDDTIKMERENVKGIVTNIRIKQFQLYERYEIDNPFSTLKDIVYKIYINVLYYNVFSVFWLQTGSVAG